MKIDLGGWLSQRSLLRRLGSPLSETLLRSWLEPMLLSIVMLRDKVGGFVWVLVCWCVVVERKRVCVRGMMLLSIVMLQDKVGGGVWVWDVGGREGWCWLEPVLLFTVLLMDKVSATCCACSSPPACLPAAAAPAVSATGLPTRLLLARPSARLPAYAPAGGAEPLCGAPLLDG